MKSKYPKTETRNLSDIKSPNDQLRAYRIEDRLILRKSITQFGLLKPLIVINQTTGNLLDGALALAVMKEMDLDKTQVWVVEIDPALEPLARMALQNHAGEWEWSDVAAHLTKSKQSGHDLNTSGFRESTLNPLLAAEWTPPAKGPLDGSCRHQIDLL